MSFRCENEMRNEWATKKLCANSATKKLTRRLKPMLISCFPIKCNIWILWRKNFHSSLLASLLPFSFRFHFRISPSTSNFSLFFRRVCCCCWSSFFFIYFSAERMCLVFDVDWNSIELHICDCGIHIFFIVMCVKNCGRSSAHNCR